MSEEQNEEMYHVPDSRVVHHNLDCHHLDNATEVEVIIKEKAESFRTCYQCSYDNLSFSEKMERKRRSRRKQKTTVKLRFQ